MDTLEIDSIKMSQNMYQKGGQKKTPSKELSKELTTEEIYKVVDLYFKQKNIMYTHLYNSFDKFFDEDIKLLLKNGSSVFFEKISKDKVYRYKFVYSDIAIKPPVLDSEYEIMFPSHARTRSMTYSAKLVATVTQVQEIIDITTDKVTTKVIGLKETEYPIANIPLMVRSKYCSLNLKKGHDKSECEYDPGGYFIVNGSEKVVMALERMIDNKPLVFIKKDSSSIVHTVQVNSKNYITDQMQIVTIRIKKDNSIIIRVPILSEVPVFIVLRALGIESDKDIINFIVYDKYDTDMLNIMRMALENSKPEDSTKKILTQEDALNYLVNKMRVIKKYNETDKDIKAYEKKMHLKALLKDSFLPHVEGNPTSKAYYLGYMINRLLQCYLGRIPSDDRDSFINKRVDLPGTLVFELFKQYYKKMLNECSKFFRKRNTSDEAPINIINQIKPNIIEQGLKTALLTGAWGKRKGVAQMLQRLSYLQTLSSLRRLNSPTVDASTNKLTSPRHLHGTSIGFCCHMVSCD
jgi:DNA-directed RNA polymerase beta subunit